MLLRPRLMRSATLSALGVVAAILTVLAPLADAEAQSPGPLQIIGAPGLDQRILTRPGARFSAAPGGAPDGAALATFSHYFVFERRVVGDKEWLRVGANRAAPAHKWLPAEATAPWRQAVVLSFNQVAERQPTLFFKQRDQVAAVAAHPDRASFAQTLFQESIGQRHGVIAQEPRPGPDFRSRFYMLPILEAEDVQMTGVRRRGGIKLVRAAWLSKSAPPPAQMDFRTGVVFVIDSTRSMAPYIARTRETVRKVIAQLRASSIGDKVSFGLVAYRGVNKDGRPVDYVAKVMHPLQDVFDPVGFQRAIDAVEEAQASTATFAEDGMAGVNVALGMDAWLKFPARFIVQITDAPSLTASDQHSIARMNPADMASRANAQDRHTALMTILLETPEGQAHHQRARSQYQQLTRSNSTARTLFFPIPVGDVAQFGATVDRVAQSVVHMTEEAQRGQLPAPSARPTPSDPVTAAIDAAGYAMQLAWRGVTQPSRDPRMEEGWTVDVDLTDPNGRQNFDIQVLLTRNQLNDLFQALSVMNQTAAEQLDAPGGGRSFFTQLRQILTRAQSDPTSIQSLDGSAARGTSNLNPDQINSLQDLVASHIRHLPYRSEILTLTPEALESMPPTELYDFRSKIDSKLNIYRLYFSDTDRWIKLHPDAPKEEEVYPVPISLLP